MALLTNKARLVVKSFIQQKGVDYFLHIFTCINNNSHTNVNSHCNYLQAWNISNGCKKQLF
jgi:hypothetical protein